MTVRVRHAAILTAGDRRATLAGVARYAAVQPLVTTRALTRPFTYLGDGLEKGDVVSIGLGRAHRRGVVVGLEATTPEGVEARPIERVLGRVPAPLVDLALWIADYYGTTPGRALALVAPPGRSRRTARRRVREPIEIEAEPPPSRLTQSQEHALSRIVEAIGRGGRFLLAGETGSGKTEVYLRSCEAALAKGRTGIVLVPEIALTPQALARFRARFGDAIAVLHSGLTEAERQDERDRLAAGVARIVVGARSAIFAPVRDLGVVCVDEEHDPAYKQESDPRYDARLVAAKRANLEGAVAIYGSATPRPESWQRLERLELGARIARPLPPVQVVDLRRETGYPLSSPLLAELGRIAERGGKAILLLNRRGIAPAVHCRGCGLTIRCDACDVSLVLHRGRALRCHHCGVSRSAPPRCPACGSLELARLGAGTERLEHELGERIPELERIRLDADATDEEQRYESILARFAAADRAVLLGTQMVAKGHHFAGVSLAAVVDADTGLAFPDFRAEERTFQLVTQLAGRSGRDGPGRVLVQTFSPDARPIAFAARHDVAGFLAGELERRRELGYPPFRHLVRILVSGPEPAGPFALLDELKARMGGFEEDVLGPAALLRLRGRARAQLLVKSGDPRPVAEVSARLLAAAAKPMRRDGLAAVVDVDPQSLG
jgi:primosomal protein N' (replication factor Y) (superfamily II helicase)